jgi:UDP-2,4-diacetamido-2,4,6-trideoxy-beta-L-altropyranose hydrolase
MKVLFRVDSSSTMGTGHVMRCLTLADALGDLAPHITFSCRDLPGNSIDLIEARGYEVARLGAGGAKFDASKCPWLGVSQQDDLADFLPLVESVKPDLTVVDHYGIDGSWHGAVSAHSARIMVIDDLANRNLDCDILLDQTYGRSAGDYSKLVPARAKLLLGSGYALLRPEFSELREESLGRRSKEAPRRILVSMGGTDPANYSGKIIAALLPYLATHDLTVEVVMGGKSPSLQSVREQIDNVAGRIKLSVDISDMASAISRADLAIGAAGTSAWERCSLGVPTLLFVVADNQAVIAANLESAGAAKIVDSPESLGSVLFGSSDSPGLDLVAMSRAAAQITDGKGAQRTVAEINRS